jgi:predicted RNA-binding Zn-ribbon protein involved in translation (DUF1610 family)
LEKELRADCPKCGLTSLNLYYEERCDSPFGAQCHNCGFIGVFTKEHLVPLAAV